MTVGSQLKQTLAVLRGARATLRLYSTQTRDKEAVAILENALSETGPIVEDLENRLQTLEFEEPQYKGF